MYMKELEEMWDEIPERSLEEKDIEAIIGRKSMSELDRFKRVLSIELYVSWGLTLAVVLMHDSFGMEMKAMVGGMVVIGSLLNIITLIKLNKIELLEDVHSFINKSLNVLKTFVAGYILTLQIVGILVFIGFKAIRSNDMPWKEWILSSEGVSLLVLYLVIEAVLISYAWLIYFKRIQSLKNLQKELRI